MTDRPMDPPPQEAEAFFHRLSTLPERAMRKAELRRLIRFVEPDVVAEQLEELVTRCVRGSREARLVHLAFVDLLLTTESEDEIALDAIDLAAEAVELRGATWLLQDPPPHRAIDATARRNMRLTKPMPLGTRKWKARMHDKRTLEALLADPDPAVVAGLCANPRITQPQILSIAARRPNYTDVLDTIARSDWLEKSAIQQALIQNPYGRTGLAIGLLPQAGTRFCAALQHSSDVHPTLKAAAAYFEGLAGWDVRG